MSLVIRQARAGELEAVARLLLAVFREIRSAPLSPAQKAALELHLQSVADIGSRLEGTDTFVAHEAGVIVGAGVLHRPHHPPQYPEPEGGRQADPWPREWASLRLLAVDAAHRGRGIGRELAQARIERARALDAPVIALHTSSIFPVAREMYRRMGWLRVRAYDLFPAPDICAEAYILPLLQPSRDDFR
jgi:GNAT superfamily N-acetyltransferase